LLWHRQVLQRACCACSIRSNARGRAQPPNVVRRFRSCWASPHDSAHAPRRPLRRGVGLLSHRRQRINFAALGPLKASASTKRLGKPQNCQQHSTRKPWRTTPRSTACPLRRRRTVDCPSRTPLKVLNLTSTSLGFLREGCKALARLASALFLALGLVEKIGGRPGRQRQHHEHQHEGEFHCTGPPHPRPGWRDARSVP
jgi:hypothetical protein